MNKDNSKTITFSIREQKELETKQILLAVYKALLEKGHKPVEQIVGYLLSGDPIYITNHKNARALITKIDRDELMNNLVKTYLGIK